MTSTFSGPSKDARRQLDFLLVRFNPRAADRIAADVQTEGNEGDLATKSVDLNQPTMLHLMASIQPRPALYRTTTKVWAPLRVTGYCLDSLVRNRIDHEGTRSPSNADGGWLDRCTNARKPSADEACNKEGTGDGPGQRIEGPSAQDVEERPASSRAAFP